MITILEAHAKTLRSWNGRDDNAQHHHGQIPVSERVVTVSLGWRRNATSPVRHVGNFSLDMPRLLRAGLIRKVADNYVLRFQRTDSFIEIAVNRSSAAQTIARVPTDL